MARTALTITTDTAARLRAAMLELSKDAGGILTIDGALNFLLDTWATWRELEEPQLAATMTVEQYQAMVRDLAARFAARTPSVTLADWQQAMLALADIKLSGTPAEPAHSADAQP